MLQPSVAAPAHARPQPDLLEDDPLLLLAGDLTQSRALIVARNGVDLMCGLVRRGCLAATALRIGDKPDANDYELLLIPRITEFASPEAIIHLARRALAPRGRLIAGITRTRDAIALARRLRLNGFSDIHTTQRPGLILLRANLRSPA